MSDVSPYSAPKPPKTITEVTDDGFLDITGLHTWIFLSFVAVELSIFNQFIRNDGTERLLYLLGIITVGLAWIEWLSTKGKVDKLTLRLHFIIDDKRGKHVVNKFQVPVPFLTKVVPLVAVHGDGILEFTDNKYGVIVELQPARIQDEEREAHEKRIEKLLNGIPANIHFKTTAISRLEPKRPVLNYLLHVTNAVEKGKSTELHLTDMYNDAAGDETKTISWKYYAFLDLGSWKTITEAKIQYGAIIPGLLKNMKVARFQPRIITDQSEIGRAYRTLYSEMVI